MNYKVLVDGKKVRFRYCDGCCKEDDNGVLCIEHPEHGWLPVEEACDECGYGIDDCVCSEDEDDADDEE